MSEGDLEVKCTKVFCESCFRCLFGTKHLFFTLFFILNFLANETFNDKNFEFI